MRQITSWIGLALAAAALPAAGDDLLQVYRDAQRYDAVFSAARFTLDAGRERLTQGRALLLPTLDLNASTTRRRDEVEPRDPAIPPFERSATANIYTFTLKQPVYRPQNLATYNQADFQVKQAEATFAQAGQDLAVRVAQAYLDVLAAEDTLALVGAQKAAISEQLAQAKRNFEVGTATITDTHEAQSRYDLIAAQEIAAQNDLVNRRQSLQLITGKEYARLAPLRADVRIPPPDPNQLQPWVDLAEKQSYAVQIQEAAAESARLAVKFAGSGHWPTLDLVARYGLNSQSAVTSTTGGAGVDTTTGSIGLELALPLYKGGGISSSEREAAANYNKIREDLHLLLPVALLVGLMMNGFSPTFSCFWATLALIPTSWLRTHTRLYPKQILEIMIKGGKNMAIVALACAGAGVFVACLTVTGVVVSFSSVVTSLAGDNVLIAGLILMAVTLVLGMGVPTTAAYIIGAAIGAPILVKMGVPLLSAHMFIFYFAILADATPPVSVASYAAASIAGADPMRTGVAAFRLGIAGFVVGLSFLYSPALLMQGPVLNIIAETLVNLIGLSLVAAGLSGYLRIERSIAWRVLMVVAGLLLVLYHGLDVWLRIGLLIVLFVGIYFSGGAARSEQTIQSQESP